MGKTIKCFFLIKISIFWLFIFAFATPLYSQHNKNIRLTPQNGGDILCTQYSPQIIIQSSFGDSIFYTNSFSVLFRVNSTRLQGNNPQLQHFIDSIIPQVERDNLKICRIEIRGGASPEGGYENNRRLSVGRANALIDTMRAYIDIPKEIRCTTIAEDYDYLQRLMRTSGYIFANEVCSIIDEHNGNPQATKKALRELHGGRAWQWMLQNLFPQLRAARVLFYYTLPQNKAEQTPTRAELATTLAPQSPVTVATAPSKTGEPARKERRQPMLSIKTNLLYDLFWLPRYGFAPVWNGSLEFYPRKGRYSLYGEFDSPWWHSDSKHKYFQGRNYLFEVRRYQRANGFYGHYLSLYGHFTRFDIEFPGRRGWQGEGVGVGLNYGYVARLGKQSPWRLELNIGVGLSTFYYDAYDPIEGKAHTYYYSHPGSSLHKLFNRPANRYWIGPTRVGISLSYDLLYYKGDRR